MAFRRISLSLLLLSLFSKISCSQDSVGGREEDLLQFEADIEEDRSPKRKSIPYALSPVHLISLSHQEEQLYRLLVDYEQKLLERLEMILRYKSDYEDTSMKILNKISPEIETNPFEKHSHIAANPILSHCMIRRFSYEITLLRQHIQQGLEITLENEIDKLQGHHLDWPVDKDLVDSANALIRITNTYEVNIMQFSEGKSRSEAFYKSDSGLTALQCIEIAERALATTDTVIASDWIQAAYTKVIVRNDTTVDTDTISQIWKRAVEMHAELWGIEDLPDDMFEDAKKEIKDYHNSRKGNRTSENVHPNYISLCRGEAMQTEAEKAKLYCWLEREQHPYFKINPQKMELKSSDPYLIQIHDFVGKTVMDVVTSAFIPAMSSPERSTVATQNGIILSDVRTSVTGWLAIDIAVTYPEIKQLLQKIEFITDLHVLKPLSSDDYQLANYAYGSHYLPHLDTLSSGNYIHPQGDRLATFIIYFEEVYTGAETVFPMLGVAVKPIKGSALFWYNHHRNGTTDIRTHHGGCPLREGFKMITTNWIYDKENFLKRPCSINQYS